MKNCGRIPWNATAICETFEISCLMGRHPTKGGSENHFNGPVIPFGAMVEYHHICTKTCRDYINLVLKSCQVCSSLVSCMRERIWKGDILVADIEELEQMDASELHARRLNAKEVLTPMRGDNFMFPVADGTVKISGGD